VISSHATALGLDGWPITAIGIIGIIGAFFFIDAIFYSTVKMISQPLGTYEAFHQALSLSSIAHILDIVIGVMRSTLPHLATHSMEIVIGLMEIVRNILQNQNQRETGGEAETSEADEDNTDQASLPPPYSVSLPNQFLLP
jgi:hypothetical protein